jgi:hypothetical protein
MMKGEAIGKESYTCGKMRNAYNILVGRPEGKSYLEIPKCNGEANIKMDLMETVQTCGLDPTGSG